MKAVKLTLAINFLLVSATSHAEQPIINLSVGGELSPGIYGQVQFGNSPPPPVLYQQPRVITHQADSDRLEPLYMHVPPRHARNWRRYCSEYHACDRRVYFVRSEEYEPGYREKRNHGHDRHIQDQRERRGERDGDENDRDSRGHRERREND